VFVDGKRRRLVGDQIRELPAELLLRQVSRRRQPGDAA